MESCLTLKSTSCFKEGEALLRFDNCKITSFPNIFGSLSLLFLVQGISGMRIPSYGQESGMVDAGRLPNWYLHPHPSA